MGSLLLHHCCSYNWLPCQHKLTPFLCVCVCASASVLLFYLSVNGVGGAIHKADVFMHTDKLSGPGGGGALNDYPTPPPSFFSLADIRRDMTPSSVPLQLSPPLWGDISISMYPLPSPPHPPHMTSLHTCPTSAPQRLCWGLTMQWKSVRLCGFLWQKCVDWQNMDEIVGWGHRFHAQHRLYDGCEWEHDIYVILADG